MRLKRKPKTNKFKITALTTAVVLLCGAVIGLGIGLFNKLDTTKEVRNSAYAIGTIDETTGKYLASNQSIYMEDMENVDGLTIEVSENAQVTYRVAYYAEDESFIMLTEALNENLDAETIPESATYFRVVITPNEVDGEAVEIKTFKIGSYAKQITVSYNK